MGDLNRKIRDFSIDFLSFLKRREKNTYNKIIERVKFGHWKLEEKRRVQVSFHGVSSITFTRKVFLIFLLHQGFEEDLGVHMPFIQESENTQEDCGLKLIKPVRFEEC